MNIWNSILIAFILILGLNLGLAYSKDKKQYPNPVYITYYNNGQVKDIVFKTDASTFNVASFYSDGQLNIVESKNLIHLFMEMNNQKGDQMQMLKGIKNSYSSTLFFTDGTYIYIISTKEVVDTFLGFD